MTSIFGRHAQKPRFAIVSLNYNKELQDSEVPGPGPAPNYSWVLAQRY